MERDGERRGRVGQGIERGGVPPVEPFRGQLVVQRMGAKCAQGDGKKAREGREDAQPVHAMPLGWRGMA